eukprot:Gb_19148 [translate_table: standard]
MLRSLPQSFHALVALGARFLLPLIHWKHPTTPSDAISQRMVLNSSRVLDSHSQAFNLGLFLHRDVFPSLWRPQIRIAFLSHCSSLALVFTSSDLQARVSFSHLFNMHSLLNLSRFLLWQCLLHDLKCFFFHLLLSILHTRFCSDTMLGFRKEKCRRRERLE